ncbi:hypothetical protein [Congregibacter litoralis]|uniref:DUF1640 domain-containing protein n=1 Tax=Congregibacter litoralis KT71 TaxID=314285 RepID=A4A6V6_9GAMM|nr:hypothetical protein [Congregibacter litoralis]EAQ98025.2 hypothetical protein KT71_02222 [Congregibacter litoralis KT71]
MALIAFDTLGCVQRLTEAGMDEKIATAQAQVMAETFIHNAEQLVTRDYLDERLRFEFASQDLRLEPRFARLEQTQRVHSVLLAIITASTVIPFLQSIFAALSP